MAYLNYLHSVPMARVEAFWQDQNQSLQATRSVTCSHGIAYWIQIQPLGQLLGEAIDGGEVLHQSLWHRFRVPKIHNVDSVARLYPDLKAAWTVALHEEPLSEDDWYRLQIDKVMDIFEWAHSHKECVVSSLP